MSDYIKRGSVVDGEIWQARVYDDFGYNLIALNPKTGLMERIGDTVKTFRYADPVFHPSTSEVLIIIKAVTRWRLTDGRPEFTKESPANVVVEHGPRIGLPAMTAAEKAGMKTQDEWKAGGFFPEVIL